MRSVLKNNKICFIHIPRQKYRPAISLLPLGLVALADYTVRGGFKPVIIHAGVEKMVSPGFDITGFIKKQGYRAVLFDLHWHYQLHDVLGQIKKLKKRLPSIPVVIGGFTASFFAKEIMKQHGEVDYVIRGDAEKPVLCLLRKLVQHQHDLRGIPNLLWRQKKRIIVNQHSYVASQSVLNRLSFSNFFLIRHYKTYIDSFSVGLGPHDTTPVFYYVPGRGCSTTCSFCGGSAPSQEIINNRTSPVFKNVNSALQDLKNITKYNIRKVNICFDPEPKARFYIRLFRAIRKNKLKIEMDFESFGLPEKEFIDEFAKTFEGASSITISPESGSEAVRRKNRGRYFSNSQLGSTLEYLQKKGIKVYLAFSAGLSFERKEDIVKTLALVSAVKNRFRNIEVNAEAISLEPASPRHLFKKRYGIISQRNSFRDFCQAHKENDSLGYRTRFLSEEDILSAVKLYRIEARCRYRQSRFQRLLADSLVATGKADLRRLYAACRGCPYYTVCFSHECKQ